MNRRVFLKSTLLGAAGAGTLRAAADGPPVPSPTFATRAVFVANLSRAEPAAALTRDFAPGCWQLVDYETREGVAGTMVYARPEDECAALTLPLGVTGFHRVYLGFNFTNSHYPGWSSHGQIDVKLSGDRGYRRVAAELGEAEGQDLFKSVIEVYWKTADLTGQTFQFRQPQPPYRWPREANYANLCYVKLVPLSAGEVREWERALPGAQTRNLAFIYCSAQLSGSTDGTENFHPTSERWFVDDFEPYRQSDIGTFIFEALRGNYALYRSRIADVGAPDGGGWRDEWVDPLASFTREAHAAGMKILAALRMIGPQYPMIRAPIGRARHYWAHSEWTKRDREGRPVGNLSLAYGGVRDYWISLLRETLAYGTDGVHLHLNRSTPFVLFEEPVVASFRAKYGEDPRRITQRDERLIQHWADYVTQFIREVRALVDEKPGRQLGVSVFGPTKERPQDPYYKNKSYVCDVERWLREGLVDLVIPSQHIDLAVLRRWSAMAGTRARICPDLMPRSMPPDKFAQLASTYRAAGAHGFGLWDGERRQARLSQWDTLRQLGHFDLLPNLSRPRPDVWRRIELRTLGGLSAQDSFRDG